MFAVIKDSDKVSIIFDQSEFRFTAVIKKDRLLKGNLPVWNVKGAKDILMSYTGETKMRDVLRITPLSMVPFTIEQLQLVVYPQLKNVCEKYDSLDDKGRFNGKFIFVNDTKIFTMDYYGVVSEHSHFIAVGEYNTIINETLSLFNEPLTINHVKKAFNRHFSFFYTTSLPLCLITTKDKAKWITSSI